MTVPLPAPQAWRPLLILGLVEASLLATLAWWPGAVDAAAARLLLFGCAFAAYAVAASVVRGGQGGAVVVWGVAVGLRLLLLPWPPALSGEVFRFLWDGQVQLGGFNPYLHAAADPELAAIRTGWFGQVPGASAPSTHPPLAQIAFLALAAAGGTVLQAKLLWLGLDLGTGWVLGRVAFLTGRSRRLTQLLYLWSPLLVVEVAGNGHMVVLGLLPAALVVLLARAPVSSGVAVGLAGAAAPVFLAGAPALLRRHGWRAALGLGGALLVTSLAYAGAGGALLRALAGPLGGDPFLGGGYLLLASALPGDTLPRGGAAAVLLGVALWTAARRHRPERALLWVVGTALLVTPMLTPCVALLILPFAALRLSRPWLLLTGVAFLAYAAPGPVGTVHPADPPLWAHLAVWLPVVGLLLWEGRRSYLDRFPLPASGALPGRG